MILDSVYHYNRLNETNYLNNKSPFGHSSNRELVGLDLRFTLPTRNENLDISFGALGEYCGDEYSGTTTDYKLNGGGVYAGVSPKLGGEKLGLSCLFAVGVFSYKEYFVFYRDNPLPVVDINERYASFGLGAMSSIGAYAKIGDLVFTRRQMLFSQEEMIPLSFFTVSLYLCQ